MFWIGVIIFGLCVIGFLVFRLRRVRVLRGGDLNSIQKLWCSVEQISDPSKQILEADKVLDQALHLLGYQGSLGEKLRLAGPRFSDLNGLWSAHKLRNKIAHEVGVNVGEREASVALRSFRKALSDLGL